MASLMMLDLALCQQLDKLVEDLTTSGQAQLDAEKTKELKKICRQSDDYVKKCFHSLMIQLEKDHSEVRLSTLQVCDELFMRSHCFRDLLLQDFQYFLELTLETNGEYPLPPPKTAAKTLKCKGGEFVHKWNEKFGQTYKKLALGYHFLKSCKNVNFRDIEMRSVVERQREESRAARTARQHKTKLKNTIEDMREGMDDMRECLTEAENCLGLLLPDLEHFDIHSLKSPVVSPEKASPQKHVNKSTKHKTPFPSGTHISSPHNHKDSVGTKHCTHVDIAEQAHVKVEPGVSNEQTTCTSKCTRTPNDESGSCKHDNTNRVASSETDIKPSAEQLAEALQQYQSTKFNDADSNGDQISSTMGESIRNSPEFVSESKGQPPSSNQDKERHEDVEGEEEGEEEEEELQEEDIVRSHGLGSQNYSVSIPIPVVQRSISIEKTSDNEDIINALLECLHLIRSKFLPSVTKWLGVFSKTGAEQRYVKKGMDIKQNLLKAAEKIEMLDIVKNRQAGKQRKQSTNDGDSSEDDDFEEVSTKDGYEAEVPAALRNFSVPATKAPNPSSRASRPPTNPDWVLTETMMKEADDPTTFTSTLQALKHKIKSEHSDGDEPKVKAEKLTDDSDPGPSTSGNKELPTAEPKSAPSIPFGTDLYHWGNKMETPLLVRYEDHRFMPTERGEDYVDHNALASMKTRVINFTGTFEPVKWTCRAPLASGKLCPRMDRVKCPFHGRIIPRDALGQPSNEDDFLRLQREEELKREERRPDWDDPEFQAELKAATGVDLQRKGGSTSKGRGTSKAKGRKGEKKKKYPGLTDINKIHNTTRHRLENKVLSKQAIRRVANAMNSIDEKRRQDKFGNNFINVHRQ